MKFEELGEHSILMSESNSADDKLNEEFLLRIIAQMPEQFSVVFNLSVFEGFSHKEISKKLGISEANSRILLHRGRSWAAEKLTQIDNINFKAKRAF